jgi:hypothetical protein
MLDGDVDGCILMGRMSSTKAEAEVIRSRLAIPKRRTLSYESRARLEPGHRPSPAPKSIPSSPHHRRAHRPL